MVQDLNLNVPFPKTGFDVIDSYMQHEFQTIASLRHLQFLNDHEAILCLGSFFPPEMLGKGSGRFTLLFATTNAGKVAEIQAYFENNRLGRFFRRFFQPCFYAPEKDVEEFGQTFSENARIKALAAFGERHPSSNSFHIGEDSGFTVFDEKHYTEVLPGVVSARFGQMVIDRDFEGLQSVSKHSRRLVETYEAAVNRMDGVILNKHDEFLYAAKEATMFTPFILNRDGLDIGKHYAFVPNRDALNNYVLLLICSHRAKVGSLEVNVPAYFTTALHACHVSGETSATGTMMSSMHSANILVPVHELADTNETYSDLELAEKTSKCLSSFCSIILGLSKDFGYNHLFQLNVPAPKGSPNEYDLTLLSEYSNPQRLCWNHRARALDSLLSQLLIKQFHQISPEMLETFRRQLAQK